MLVPAALLSPGTRRYWRTQDLARIEQKMDERCSVLLDAIGIGAIAPSFVFDAMGLAWSRSDFARSDRDLRRGDQISRDPIEICVAAVRSREIRSRFASR
jgi:hypothetical protein